MEAHEGTGGKGVEGRAKRGGTGRIKRFEPELGDGAADVFERLQAVLCNGCVIVLVRPPPPVKPAKAKAGGDEIGRWPR